MKKYRYSFILTGILFLVGCTVLCVPCVRSQAQNPTRVRISIPDFGFNQLQVYSFSGGIVVGGTQVTAEVMTITKGVDSGSPTLSLRLATGVHATDATISVFTVDANNVETLFLTIKMECVHVAACNVDVTTSKSLASPVEVVTLDWHTITYTYRVPGQSQSVFMYDRQLGGCS